MKIVGLITEYNPFHNGHLYHLNESKKQSGATHAIAVMSGHFLQRGEPAIMNKWVRAQNAVLSGVDLVIELPTLFACNSAEYFAYGAVSLLNALNCVDTLCFGSEEGSLEEMNELALLLNQPTEVFNQTLQKHLNSGYSYPKSRTLALEELYDFQLDFKPNNILGVEYLKALHNLKSSIKPMTIKRIHADYMSTELKGHIASATGIRQGLKEHKDIQQFVPSNTAAAIFHEEHLDVSHLGDLLLYKIRTMTLENLREIHDINEGLEYRIKEAAQFSGSYDELLEKTLTKRYTRTRIQRIFMKILLNITKEMMDTYGKQPVTYARILAFNEKGQEILNHIRKTSEAILITNVNKIEVEDSVKELLTLDLLATDIYHLLYMHPKNKKGGRDYLITPRPL